LIQKNGEFFGYMCRIRQQCFEDVW